MFELFQIEQLLNLNISMFDFSKFEYISNLKTWENLKEILSSE
jgi:hypothetical protein